MVQKDRVLNYIKEHGSITTLEAIDELGVTRLSGRIYELKHKDGIVILGRAKSVKDRYGKTITVTEYYLND